MLIFDGVRGKIYRKNSALYICRSHKLEFDHHFSGEKSIFCDTIHFVVFLYHLIFLYHLLYSIHSEPMAKLLHRLPKITPFFLKVFYIKLADVFKPQTLSCVCRCLSSGHLCGTRAVTIHFNRFYYI